MVTARRRCIWACLASVLIGCAAGCSTSPVISASEAGRASAKAAIALIDTPYRYGGNIPQGGFDCSGLIGYVLAQQPSRRASQAPRTVRELSVWGQVVELSSVREGDLVFFGPPSRGADHAGIYVGEGRFVHAPSTGGKVRMDRIDAPYWKARLRVIRRPPDGR